MRAPELQGRVVAVTGAARGIGFATAGAFARAGARVAIGDLDRAKAEEAAAAIGAGTLALPLDVSDRGSFERFLDETERASGPLDVLVNNAGIMPMGPFLEETEASARRQLDINCHGVLHGMKLALPRFAARGRGHLVNVASIVGKVPVPGVATYSGSKHFVVGVSEAARLELRGSGVELSCVMPGPVNTELTAGAPTARFVRYAEPEDVAAAIVAVVARPRFEVYVPRSVGPISRLGSLLPRRGREGLGRLLKADTALAETDWAARRAYEERISAARLADEPESGATAAESNELRR